MKSLVGSALIMLLLQFMPLGFSVAYIHPGLAAVAGGTFCGMGILAFARHGAGVGGIGIVTLWIRKRYGINASYAQILLDLVILLVGACTLGHDNLGWSIVSAAAASGMVMAWHRPGRYVA